MQRLAIGWLGWTLSHSNLWVGLIAFAGLAPVLFLSPAFGVLVDRSDVRRASILVNGILMLLAAVLAVLVWTGGLTKELLLLLSLLVGTVSAAYTPVRLSLVAALVPRELMPSAVAATSIVFNLSRLIGPAVGGIVLASASAAWAFAINAVSFVPLMASLFVVKLAKADDRGEARHFLNELRAGFAHAGESLFLLWQLLITASLACLGRSALEVLPVYTTGFYGEGAQGLAALATAAAAGAIAASLACSQVELTTPQLQTATILLALLCGLCLLILPASRELWFGLAIFAMIGFAGTSGSIFSQTLVQVEVGNAFRARVTSPVGDGDLRRRRVRQPAARRAFRGAGGRDRDAGRRRAVAGRAAARLALQPRPPVAPRPPPSRRRRTSSRAAPSPRRTRCGRSAGRAAARERGGRFSSAASQISSSTNTSSSRSSTDATKATLGQHSATSSTV